MANRVAKYPKPTVCLYCESNVIYTSNKEVYGKEFGNGKCYKCTNCDAYVGVHSGTDIPLGRMANKELRELKKKAHALFDPTWQKGKKKRSQAYSDLAIKLGIKTEECHFGWFDKEMLDKAIKILKSETSNTVVIEPKKMLKECVGFLRKDMSLTDKWGIDFIKSLIKTVKDGRELTEKQVNFLNEQHSRIKKNAKKKNISI